MGGVLPSAGVSAVRLNSDLITWPMRDGFVRREKTPAANGHWVGLILLFDTHTGEPLMITPDGYLQRTRVAGASGIGARYLAREDARTVALLGSGWQAEGQIEALLAVRPIEEIRVFSPNREHREAFAQRMAARWSCRIIAVESADAAATGADIIAAATNSLDPVIRSEWMQPGVHLGTITVNEVDGAVVEEVDRIAFHTRAYAKEQTFRPADAPPVIQQRAGWWSDPSAPVWERISDLGMLAAGKATGREGEDEVTLFVNNIGMGLQFAAVGARVFAAARAQGLGHELPTDWFTQSVHP
jgi:ornithine cyclodeaminase/alanine dehydrogenase-like protein (mu-crystallin family)